jgi:hypothetical protein
LKAAPLLVVMALALSSFVPAVLATSGSAGLALAPRNGHTSSYSTNWSGYAVTGAKGSVKDVKGEWTVPAIQGTCPSTNQYSSFWVGIDGYNSGTVEQTGTDSDCQGGAPVYYAWFEFYPHPSYLISSVPVKPGDTVSAEAKFNGRAYVVTLKDVTTGKSFSTSAKVSSAQRTSAEWIAEAPYSGGILPLANFGTINFFADKATVGTVTAPIGSFISYVQITMVTNSNVVKAQPSALSPDGTSFSVTWKSSGP